MSFFLLKLCLTFIYFALNHFGLRSTQMAQKQNYFSFMFSTTQVVFMDGKPVRDHLLDTARLLLVGRIATFFLCPVSKFV